MIMRMIFGTALLATMTACGDSDTAEERYFDHYQESVEQAREVEGRLERAHERRLEMMEDQDPKPPQP